MSVYLRGKSYHYRFLFKGKDYSGVCSGCSAEARAKEYERSIGKKNTPGGRNVVCRGGKNPAEQNNPRSCG